MVGNNIELEKEREIQIYLRPFTDGVLRIRSYYILFIQYILLYFIRNKYTFYRVYSNLFFSFIEFPQTIIITVIILSLFFSFSYCFQTIFFLQPAAPSSFTLQHRLYITYLFIKPFLVSLKPYIIVCLLFIIAGKSIADEHKCFFFYDFRHFTIEK